MKIIKPGKKSFVATCSRCGCQFEYTIEELRSRWPHNYMPCPECENEVYHKNQDVEDRSVMYNSTEVKPDWVTTSTDLPMTEIKLPKTNSSEDIFIGNTAEYINDNSSSGRASDFGINGETGTASSATYWK